MKIYVVMVTYNRLSLLKKAISALTGQTTPVSCIIVVDNHSTDGTSEYLKELSSVSSIQVVTMQKNTGGAGGFSEGIKQAALQGADWIWVMDDDTIPSSDALEQMLPYTKVERIGFIGSRVLWTDGNLHKMNLPHFSDNQTAMQKIIDKTGVDSEKFKMVDRTSFVSLLIRGNIPWEIGLPYRDFFIWGDDVEYTQRISNHRYMGVWAENSVVLHETKTNTGPSLKTIPASAAMKVYYGIRNDSFLRRQRKGKLMFLLSQVNCFRTHAHRIKSRRLPKDEEKTLLAANNRGLWNGFFFSPQIEFLSAKQQ